MCQKQNKTKIIQFPASPHPTLICGKYVVDPALYVCQVYILLVFMCNLKVQEKAIFHF